MKHKILVMALPLVLSGCGSASVKIEPVVTPSEAVAPVFDKAQASERLRESQTSVYLLEDQVYGARKQATLGQYGELKSCLRKLASKQYGGIGSMTWGEPLDRVTDKESAKGSDEGEEALRQRVERFKRYKTILQRRAEDFSERTMACKVELATKTCNASESSRVLVNEAPKTSLQKPQINLYMCGFVHSGAGLESFMLNGFAQGWLALADFEMAQNLIGGEIKDSKGTAQPNGFLFNGWKLAFDTSPVTVGNLLEGGKNARLVAWAFDRKADVSAASTCLDAPDGVWNH